jgi:hypothetical protein
VANAISGSTIQNSAKWRLVFEFSARKGRLEGVHLGQCEAVGLDIELARDRQERFAASPLAHSKPRADTAMNAAYAGSQA